MRQLAPLPDPDDGRIDAAEHRLNAAQACDALLLQAVMRDIPSHAAVADDASKRVEQRQRIAVEPADAARRVLQVQLHVAPAALFRNSPPQELSHGGAQALRYEVEAALPDQLIRCIPQDDLHRRTAEGIEAVRIDLPDPLLGGLGDGAKSFLAGAQRPLGVDAVRDVLDLINEIVRLARLQPNQRAAQLGPDDAPVLADVALVGLIAIDRAVEHLA
jgi:hypothetical protein